LSTRIFPLILFTLLLTAGYTCSQAWGDAAEAGGQASVAGPAAPTPQPSPGSVAASVGSQNKAPVIDAQVRKVLDRACRELSSARTITYHAEINFDSVLTSGVKIQYAAAMDTALQRPDHLAISYISDLGAKAIWYDGKTLTIYDPAHRAYAIAAVPGNLDAMFRQVANQKNLSIPLEGLDFNNECARAYREIQRGKYIGLNDVDGTECDHLGFIQEQADWQLWVTHTGKALPRKIVITYKTLPAEPQWSAVMSDWRFDKNIPASIFKSKISKGAVHASFVELQRKEKKP
jgi:hypothetical protein